MSGDQACMSDWEEEVVGNTTIEMWVVAAMCDGHQRFDQCKNVPHLNPNILYLLYSACHYVRHSLFPCGPNL